VTGLQGLPQPEDQIDAWPQRAWDEVTDMTLESEEEQADTDTQRKRPDAWAVVTSDIFSFLISPGRMIGVSYPFMTLTRSRRIGTLRCETFKQGSFRGGRWTYRHTLSASGPDSGARMIRTDGMSNCSDSV
jgi:hypothetical protein